MNKACKLYLKNLKLFLPIRHKREKQFFKDIQFSLNNLSIANPSISYPEICEELGNPEEVISDYYSNCDSSYLTKNLRISNYIRKLFIAILIALTIVTGVRSFYLHKLYIETQKEIPTHYTETIE